MPIPVNYGADEIYQLAAQAGMVPQEAPMSEPQGTAGVMGGQLTPPDAQLSTPLEPLPPPGMTGTKTSTSMGMSEHGTGFSPGKAAQVDQRDAALARDQAAGEAAARAAGAPQVAAVQTARDSGVAAATDVAKAHADKTLAEGHEATLLSNLQDSFASEEAKINAQATAESNQSKAGYIAALADLRASKVDPSQLWSNMSGGGRFGMLVSAFVQDFLGARGIHTSAMETFNKAVDRNIDSQIQAIKTKGEVAEGFKSLWYMQRNQSASDAEARTRVRGFLLEGAKQAVTAHMSQYEAGLATAQGQAAIAKIDGDLADNLIKVYQHIDQSVTARRQQALQWHGDKLKAAMEGWGHSIQERALQEQIDARNAAKTAASDPRNGLLYDTSASGGGKARWVRNQDTRDEDWTKVKELQANTDHLQRLSREYQELNRKYHKQGPFAGTRWSSDDDQRLRAISGEIVESRALKLTGKAASDQERKVIAAGTPEELFGGSLNIAPTLAQTERHSTEELDGLRRLYALPLDPKDSRAQFASPDSHFGEAERGENLKIEAGTDTPKETTTDVALQHMATPNAGKTAGDDDYKAMGMDKDAFKLEWEHFSDPHVKAAQKILKPERRLTEFEGGNSGPNNADVTGAFDLVSQAKRPPGYAVEVGALRKQAETGDKKALNKLVEIATQDPASPDSEDPNLSQSQRTFRHAWAQYELHGYLAATDNGKNIKAPEPKAQEPDYVNPNTTASPTFEPAKTRYIAPRNRR